MFKLKLVDPEDWTFGQLELPFDDEEEVTEDLTIPRLQDCPKCGWFRRETEPGSGFFSCPTCDLPKKERENK